MPISALAFNCTLKSTKGGETSSTDALLSQLVDQLRKFDVETEIVRAVDHDIKPAPIMIWERATLGPSCAKSC
jgi:hypothetical protein